MIWPLLWVYGAGFIGGLVAGVATLDEAAVRSPLLYEKRKEGEERVCRFLGWLVYALLGGLSALVFFSLYGPFSGVVLVGPVTEQPDPTLTLSQLAASVVLGMGGPSLLILEAKRRCAEPQNGPPT